MKLRQNLKLVPFIFCVALTSCTTVKMPSLDILRGNAFSEDLKTIETSIPDVDEAPEAPTDVRSTQDWDASANEIIAVRDGFVSPSHNEEPMTAEEISAEFEAKKNKVQAYKLDDPIE